MVEREISIPNLFTSWRICNRWNGVIETMMVDGVATLNLPTIIENVVEYYEHLLLK